MCDFSTDVEWGKIVHFGIVATQNLKWFFRFDTVILKKKKHPTKTPHDLAKIHVLILHLVTPVTLLNKLNYLCVFLEDL